MPPKRCTVCSTRDLQSSSELTSHLTQSTLPSGATDGASSQSLSYERAAITTRAPSEPKSRALASPIPELAPVTMMTLSLKYASFTINYLRVIAAMSSPSYLPASSFALISLKAFRV